MRTILQCMLIISLLQFKNTEAATVPEIRSSPVYVSDSSLKNLSVLNSLMPTPHKKVGFIRKLEYRFLDKRMKKWMAHHHAADTPKGNVLATVSLILGLIGAITIFIPAIGIVALIAAPAALITGIIALGKNYNNNKGSRAQAIIGVTLGSIIIALFFVAIIVFLSGGWY